MSLATIQTKRSLRGWLQKHRSSIGIVLTLVWLGGFCWWSLHCEWPKKGNEWGDWAAGMFAPVAFFWLVLGYFQQGDELRLNTEALLLQQQELKNQVTETAILAKNSERQAIAAEQMVSATLDEKQRTAIREQADALPIFRALGGTQTPSQLRTTVRNLGSTVMGVVTESLQPGVKVRLVPAEVFEANGEAKLKVSGALTFPLKFKMSFTDALQRRHTKTFELTAPSSLREIATE